MSTIALKSYRPSKSAKRPSLWSFIGIPSRGEGLHRTLNAGVSFTVFQKLAQASGIEQQELAQYARISRASLQRRKEAGHFTPGESDRLYRFAEVFNAATDLFEGNAAMAKIWLEEPAHGLGGRRPMDMLGSTAETESVLDLIGRLEHGVTV